MRHETVELELELVGASMNLWDLTKATLICGGLAFLVYSVPEVSQALIIAILTLGWLSCAHQVALRLLGRDRVRSA